MQPIKRKLDVESEKFYKKPNVALTPRFFTLNVDLTGMILEYIFQSQEDIKTYINFRFTSINFRDITNTPRYFPHLRGLMVSKNSQCNSIINFLKRFAPDLQELDLLQATSKVCITVPLKKILLLYKEKIISLSVGLSRRGVVYKTNIDLSAFEKLKKIHIFPLNDCKMDINGLGKLKSLEEIRFTGLYLSENITPLFTLTNWNIIQIGAIRISRSDLNPLYPIGEWDKYVYNGPVDEINGKISPKSPTGAGHFFLEDGRKLIFSVESLISIKNK